MTQDTGALLKEKTLRALCTGYFRALLVVFIIALIRYSFAATYPIVEPDLLEEIEARIPEAIERFKQKLPELMEKLKNYRPKDIIRLSPARKNYSYTVSITYTLPYDIPKVDENGKVVGVLYPKGYTFNPLDYIHLDLPTLVVFNGKRKPEIEWVKKHWINKPNIMLIITEGSWHKLSNQLERPVFYLTSQMIRILNLKHTISVVYRDRKNRSLMRVDVYSVKAYPK